VSRFKVGDTVRVILPPRGTKDKDYIGKEFVVESVDGRIIGTSSSYNLKGNPYIWAESCLTPGQRLLKLKAIQEVLDCKD
jgi:hypothetical protein